MIIVGQLICIFAKTVDMAMHLSVKKLVRKWKVLLKRLKRKTILQFILVENYIFHENKMYVKNHQRKLKVAFFVTSDDVTLNQFEAYFPEGIAFFVQRALLLVKSLN